MNATTVQLKKLTGPEQMFAADPSNQFMIGKDFVLVWPTKARLELIRVIWSLLFILITLPAFSQRIDSVRYDPHPTYCTFSSSQDSLLWNYEYSEGEQSILSYTRTSAPYWEGSYLLEQCVWLKFRWLEITPAFTAGRSTFAYQACHTLTGDNALIFITVEYIHLRQSNKQFSQITSIQVFQQESLQPWE